MTAKTVPNFEVIFNEAVTAAVLAADASLDKYGDHSTCGFASVEMKPARGPFVTWLKKQTKSAAEGLEEGTREYRIAIQQAEILYGSKEYGRSGWSFYNPSKNRAQSLHVKEAGADAFAAVLRKYGYDAYTCTNVD